MYQPQTGMISNAEFIAKLIEFSSTIPTIKTGKHEQFYNVPAGFDIETTSFYNPRGEKSAIMYEWTLGIYNFITYGRTWTQFKILLDAVSKILGTHEKNRLVIYVHNLPYEFQFMRKHFSWTKVFLLDDRKPVYAITDLGIEFRCSLKLSGKSLASTAQDLTKYKVEKMVGDLDYSLIRHSKTPLTEKELNYCEHDVRVILHYIQEKIEQDGNIARIPLTNTGYVRRYTKDACFPERRILENASTYDLDDLGAVGVYRAERVLSRWIHSCECPPRPETLHESWLVRLHEFLSRRYGSRKVSNIERQVSWFS